MPPRAKNRPQPPANYYVSRTPEPEHSTRRSRDTEFNTSGVPVSTGPISTADEDDDSNPTNVDYGDDSDGDSSQHQPKSPPPSSWTRARTGFTPPRPRVPPELTRGLPGYTQEPSSTSGDGSPFSSQGWVGGHEYGEHEPPSTEERNSYWKMPHYVPTPDPTPKPAEPEPESSAVPKLTQGTLFDLFGTPRPTQEAKAKQPSADEGFAEAKPEEKKPDEENSDGEKPDEGEPAPESSDSAETPRRNRSPGRLLSSQEEEERFLQELEDEQAGEVAREHMLLNFDDKDTTLPVTQLPSRSKKAEK